MRHTLLIFLLLLITFSSHALEAISIHPLKASGIEKSDAEVLTDAIRTEISHIGTFDIMERSEMENILKEQGFQSSGACEDDACAIEMGKILAVKYMVLGNVGKLGKTYSISIRLVDVGTGKIVRDKSDYYKGEIDKLLTEVVPRLARNLIEGLGEKTETKSQTASTENGEPKKKRGGLIAGISLGVAAVAAVPLVLILTKDDNTNDSNEPTETDITISWE